MNIYEPSYSSRTISWAPLYSFRLILKEKWINKWWNFSSFSESHAGLSMQFSEHCEWMDKNIYNIYIKRIAVGCVLRLIGKNRLISADWSGAPICCFLAVENQNQSDRVFIIQLLLLLSSSMLIEFKWLAGGQRALMRGPLNSTRTRTHAYELKLWCAVSIVCQFAVFLMLS